VADGDDELAGVQSLDLGEVCADQPVPGTVAHWVRKVSNTTVNQNNYANAAVVTFTVVDASAGLSAEMDTSPATVTLPATWRTSTNGTVSDSVTSTVTLTAREGPFTGTVRYRASAPFSGGVTSNEETLQVSADVVDCTPTVVDTTPPEITPVVTGPLGQSGWYTGDVTVAWQVTDAESAVSSSQGCDAATVTDDTAGTTFTCTASSEGGTSAESVTIKRDATPPTSTVTGVQEGAVYGTAPTVGCEAVDNLSGVALHGTPTGASLTAGPKEVTCDGARDVAGNEQAAASPAVRYTLAPIGSFNANFDGSSVLKVKPNQAIPLKWAFNDGTRNHALLSSAAISSVASTRCASAEGTDGSEVAAGASRLQLLPDSSYQMNWKASTTTGCRALTVAMTFADGGSTSRTMLVQISAK